MKRLTKIWYENETCAACGHVIRVQKRETEEVPKDRVSSRINELLMTFGTVRILENDGKEIKLSLGEWTPDEEGLFFG